MDIVSPQPDGSTLPDLEELEALGNVHLHRGNQLAYDHLDLTFDGVFASAGVREAFLKTVPRQAIVDATVQGLQPGEEPLDSQVFLIDQAGYGESAAGNGSSEFAEVDVAGARELLDGETPVIRVLYDRDNAYRAEAFRLIRESAAEAGFDVVDGGLPAGEWAAGLGSGSYDAAIFGWTASGVGVAGVPQIFATGAASNYNGFSSPEADELMARLVVETDTGRREELSAEIDRLIWEANYGLPLYQLPGLHASADTLEGVEYMPNSTGLWWNAWEWKILR